MVWIKNNLFKFCYYMNKNFYFIFKILNFAKMIKKKYLIVNMEIKIPRNKQKNDFQWFNSTFFEKKYQSLTQMNSYNIK